MRYKRIRELREDNDLKQLVVARFLKVGRTTYTKYELGITEVPIPALSKLADLYNSSIDYIVERTNDTPMNLKANSNYPVRKTY